MAGNVFKDLVSKTLRWVPSMLLEESVQRSARRWRVRRVCLDVAALVFACFLTTFALGQSDPLELSKDLHTQEDDIREAIFRYRIGTEKSTTTIFLSINGKDPSGEFMARFSNSQLPVKKASGSHFRQGF